MDKSGAWSLSPAYDVTFNQGSGHTSSHQMTINMKSDGFGLSDFKACAKVAGRLSRRAKHEKLRDKLGVTCVGP